MPPNIVVSLSSREQHTSGRTHSLATGPVMAEPFISPLGLTITPALSCRGLRTNDDEIKGGAHLEVEEDTVSPAPGLALADDDGGHGCE